MIELDRSISPIEVREYRKGSASIYLGDDGLIRAAVYVDAVPEAGFSGVAIFDDIGYPTVTEASSAIARQANTLLFGHPIGLPANHPTRRK